MGLFNRATRHSGGHGTGHAPATEGREPRDTDLGAELAELGELVPERQEEPLATEVSDTVAAEGSDPSATSAGSATPGFKGSDPAPDASENVVDELQAVEEAPPEEVEVSSAGSGSDAVETYEPTPDEVPDPSVDAEEDPDAGRISFEDALSPRRGAISAATPDLGESDAKKPVDTAKVISFANQKGGVAKTTTTLNLAVAFAESGYRVLCIDLDPQGNLTMSQGIDPDKVEKSMYDVLVHHIPLTDIIQHREIDIAVASIDLAGAEIAMSTQIGRERSLEKAIRGVQSDYDFVCIDTPPSLGLLTVNALTASDSVIVPVQCEYLSMRGLMQLQNTLEMIKENLNPRVEIEGILPTMLDSRTVHAKEAVELLEENFGDTVFKTRIRKAIKFAEAPVRGASVLKYDPKSNAADYYRELAKEVLAHGAT